MQHEHEKLLAQVLALYEQGKLVCAFKAGRALGPLRRWPGTQGRVLAGRLAGQLGARRESDALLFRAFRRDPSSPLARYYYVSTLLHRHGPFAALEVLQRSSFETIRDDQLAADWYGLAAQIYGHLRDFETAESYLAKAFVPEPAQSFRWVERAGLFLLEDRYDEALSAARRSVEIDPVSRAGVSQLASLLVLRNCMDEALELLRVKLEQVESPPIACQLAELEYEVGDYRGALASLERAQSLAPITDKSMLEYLAQRRCDAYLRIGDTDQALSQARLCPAPQYKAFAERLESGAHEHRRAQLPVAFVRQHHMTCAPATLTAISHYWSKPADHLEVAEEICYDGTPHSSERRWARDHGFVAREFRVDWECAQALIDRGVPFTLTTVYPSFAHLQAVIGYDALRGTLLIRDPTQPTQAEFAQKPLFEWGAANGPRGMLLVPADQAELVGDVQLPEAELYDLLHTIQCALSEHRRDEAVAVCAQLEQIAPGHRIALEARRSVANYDAHDADALIAVEALLRLYPTDVPLRLHKTALIGQTRPPAEQLAYLEAQLHGAGHDPMFDLRIAQILLNDARQHKRAAKLLKRAARAMPLSAETFSVCADLEWQRANYAYATLLYRLASTQQITHEGLALSYFRAARQVGEQEHALDYLRARVARLGRLSSAPAITLFRCLHEIDRTSEALEVLNTALASDPEDGALALFAAGALAALSDFERAWPLLTKAQQRTRRIDWLRTAVGVYRCAGDLPAALAASREVTERAPLDLDAQRACAQLLGEVESKKAALDHLRAAAARFAHHVGLAQLLVEQLSDEPLEVQEHAIRNMLQLAPDYARARCELAMVLARQQRFEASLEEMEHARALNPESDAYYSCLAYVHTLRGDHAAARSAARAALAICVDLELPLHRLLEACASQDERREQLAYVYEQLKRQVIRGDGMLIFQELARTAYEPEELLAILNEGLAARPDLWHAWISVVRQLASMERLRDAQSLCDQAVERFALLPRVHLELAEIRRLRGDRAGERDALREALRLSPGWTLAYMRLADSFEADGHFADARAVIERATRHAPTDAYLHGYLADALWRQGEREKSVEHLVRALQLDPGYEWAWQTLRAWGAQTGTPQRAAELARELSAARPADTRVAIAVTLVCEDFEERMRAADRAIQLAPLSIRAHRSRIQLLVEQGQFESAHAMLREMPWGEALPTELRAERARVFSAQGDVQAAIIAMREVLDADPRYADGWLAIAEWYSQLNDAQHGLEAARELLRLRPNDPVALACLVDAHLRQPSPTDVRPWLRRALELRPNYVWAASQLFDADLKAGDLDAAQRSLAQLKALSASPATLGREIALLASRGDKRTAFDRFGELIRISGSDGGAIAAATQALYDAGWRYALYEALDNAVHGRSAHAEAGVMWVRVGAAVLRDRFVLSPAVLANETLGLSAARAYLEHLAQKRDRARLGHFLGKHRERLRADAHTWATAGYALLQSSSDAKTCAWLSDWEQRQDLEPWMLLNYALALRNSGRWREAGAVSEHALRLPRDRSTLLHSVWLAADAALAERPVDAIGMLAKISEAQLDAYSRCARHLTLALIGLQEQAQPDAAIRRRSALAEITNAHKILPTLRRHRALGRYADVVLWRLARAHTARKPIAVLIWLWWRAMFAWDA